MKVKIVVCFGTRPEAIKLAPVIKELRRRSAFEVKVYVTAQHREMLDQVLELFGIEPDEDLSIMRPGQSLEELTAEIVVGMSHVLEKNTVDLLIVQGDTTTTFASALAAFYKKIDVAHIEAGLRTYDKRAPYPEEVNRLMTSKLADWHFAPTQRAQRALLAEGIDEKRVFMVGNTVIDALLEVVKIARREVKPLDERLSFLDKEKSMVLITGHRRENFGNGFERICNAIAALAKRNSEVEFLYPVHMNPNVQKPVKEILSGLSNVHLIEPQDYLSFVRLMDRCRIVLTDSGGIQEEAPALGKPVLVMRDVTERPEAIEAGAAKLVGTDVEIIVSSVQKLLDNKQEYARMSEAGNPYGDGTSAKQIADVLEEKLECGQRAAGISKL